MQNRITAAVAGEGGDPAWSARVAAEARVQVAPPSVTNVTATGARFCGTTLTVQPPGEAQPQTAAITYFVTPSGAVGDVQGDVALTRRIAAMGRPAPAPARRTATSVKPQAAKATDPAPASRLPEVATKRPQVVPSAPPKAVGAPVSLLPPSVTPRREPRDDAPVAACADVWSRAEAMICATPALKAQHRALTATLDRILLSGEAYTIKRAIDGQRRFLARRDNCKDAACIARRYDDRLTDLARIEAKGNVR